MKTFAMQYQNLLGDNLNGIYIHGSIAFGCFHWDRSDIDFIVVVKDKISRQTKMELLHVLEKLSAQAPAKGFEMSVVRRKYCKNFVYPTPYELHFSEAWRMERYFEEPTLLCDYNMQTDYDLAAHFTVIKSAGLVLCGEKISEVFGNIPEACYLDSICLDIKNARADVADNPVYVILNLCRVCAYIKDKAILSKEQGGQWALDNLPDQYHDLINTMLNNYMSGAAFATDQELQKDFCNSMHAFILDHSERL